MPRLLAIFSMLLTLWVAAPLIAQEQPIDRSATGGAQTLEDILARQRGEEVQDRRRDLSDAEAQAKALVGPWIHKYPHFAWPKPRADFHGEAIRWWNRWLRDEPPLESIHFLIALPAALGFAGAGALGLWLERKLASPVRGLHAWLGALGVLLGLAAGVAGFAILP